LICVCSSKGSSARADGALGWLLTARLQAPALSPAARSISSPGEPQGMPELESFLMHTAQRAIRRLALWGCVGFLSLAGLPAHLAQAAAPPERILPDTTFFFLKIKDLKTFAEAFRGSQYGQVWNDPSLKEFREELAQRLDDTSKSLRERIGVNFKELLEIPQGALAVAGISRDDSDLPAGGAIIADAGANQKKLLAVLERAGKEAENSGAKASTESFNGLTLHVVHFPQKEPEKDDKDKEKPAPRPPLVWTNAASQFFIGSDVEIIKDLAAHREGRDNSLGTLEAFAKTQAKTDATAAHAIWYIDIAKVVKAVIKSYSKGVDAQAQQTDVLVSELGVYGLKSVGGALTLGTGSYDSLTKTFFNAPKPITGLLKVFSFPPMALRPESWVPATVATYQTLSIDLDNAYTALNDVINKFQPGMVNLIEQQLVGPNGGQPLSFQNDVFGPLGDRVTLISDFKKPIKEDSQRMLAGIALEDTKAFQNTLTRLFEVTGAAPEKREFQGTTIYDFAVNLPNAPPGANAAQQLKGPISIAIAKDTLFLTTDTTLLEQVLRPGNATLADSTSYQTVAKEFPDKMSGLSYIRPDESARLSYDLLKSGQFEKALQQGLAARQQGREIPNLGKLIPVEKLPDFSTFVKYLTLGGSASIMDDDGFTLTGFNLRRSSP
jgi:hypothetical protein